MFLLVFLLEILQFLWMFLRTTLLELAYMILRNRPRKDISGAHILITGSSSGLGKLLAAKLACDNNTLHLADINTTLNEKNKQDLAGKNCTVHTYTCDVGNLDSILQLKQDVSANCAHLQYLFNNAGVIVGKLFTEVSLEEVDHVMFVNGLGGMRMTRVFLDEMVEHGGHIIFVGSVAGLIGAPYMTTYTASKHVITGFTRSLLCDLEYAGADHVKVTTVFPHFIDTGLVTGATVKLPQLFPLLKPEWAVEQILTATREERDEVILPRITNYVLVFVYLMDTKVFRAFCKLLGNDLMKTFRQTREHRMEH